MDRPGRRRAAGSFDRTRSPGRDHDFEPVIMDAVGDVDQAVRLMKVAPFDGVVGHFHDGLPKLHHLVVAPAGSTGRPASKNRSGPGGN